MISACVLYTLQFNKSPQALLETYRIVGVTLLTGIIALFFTARTRVERIVYLNRREVSTENHSKSATDQSLIDPTALATIIDSRTDVAQRALNEICRRVGAGQGAIYTKRNGLLELTHGYAIGQERLSTTYNLGEGIVGRVAVEGTRLCLDSVPAGYITVYSGLGNASPRQLVLTPLKEDNQIKGVIEIAAFTSLNERTLNDIEECAAAIATAIY